MAAEKEPFPLLNTALDPASFEDDGSIRRRRKSSGLGGDIRAGDTGAPAFASSLASINSREHNGMPDSPTTPTTPTTAATLGNSASASTKKGLKRRRARGLVSRVRQTLIRRTFVLPAVILLLSFAGYALNPTESNILRHFIFLSYPLPQTDPDQPIHYGKGKWDIAFVAFYTVVLSFTREFVMQELLRPMARRSGLSRAKQARFMEQAYTAVYFFFLGPAGVYVMSRTPVWYFNTRGMYEGFPHRTHEGVVKFYYLFQAAYWAQQAIVLLLGMEKPRKDYKELVGHHIVSLSLIGLSYRFHFTYMGIAVYTTHDISDFFLATSKILNYLDHVLIGPYFFMFVCVWVYLRHVINIKILISLFTEFRTVGPFDLNWETEQYKCWISQYITTALLASLQALNLFWLFYIVRIAYRFLRDDGLADDRSDDEEDEDVDAQKRADKKTDIPTVQVNGQKINGKAKGKSD